MAVPERRVIELLDAAGKRRLLVIDTIDAGQTAAIANAILAHTNATWLFQVVGPLQQQAAAPANAQWPSVDDEAELGFGTGIAPFFARLPIPAPLANIFLADGETVDPVAVGDVVAACSNALRAPNGGPVITFAGGLRRGSGERP